MFRMDFSVGTGGWKPGIGGVHLIALLRDIIPPTAKPRMTDRLSSRGAAARSAPHAGAMGPRSTTSSSVGTRPLLAFWQESVFSLGGIDFLHIDVALAAMVFGEWARFERRLAEGLACTTRA